MGPFTAVVKMQYVGSSGALLLASFLNLLEKRTSDTPESFHVQKNRISGS